MASALPRTTIVSTSDLAANLTNRNWAIIDCRFDLSNPAYGRQAYLEAHIPGAVYADLNADLSGPVQPGVTGRHPLPDLDKLAQRLGALGIDENVQVVVYDDAGGLYAGRLWWLLRFLGHANVALLDGDWRAWRHEQRPMCSGNKERTARTFTPNRAAGEALACTIDADAIAAQLGSDKLLLLDARGADRYRGENETIDPIAGHIPGARSAPFTENLDVNGFWRDAESLRQRYRALLGKAPGRSVVVYCGSGVSACHTLLALEIAGLRGVCLYPGSWSHWITDPARPLAQGVQAE